MSHPSRRTFPQRLAIVAVALAAALTAGNAAAEEARMVADLTPGFTGRGSGTGPFVALGAAPGSPFVFAADDDRHGNELWFSDGTPAGTRRVLDVCPGACSSDPHGLTRVGDQVYFFADDGGWPFALYVTDGTTAGTRRVHELADAIQTPSWPVAMGNLLIFQGATAAQGLEIYRSDGTRAGTRMISDRCPGECSTTGFHTATVTDQGLFWAASSSELLHLNLAGTAIREVDGVCPNSIPCLGQLGELDGKLIYTEYGELNVLDGANGPGQMLELFLSTTTFGPFVRSGGKLFFPTFRNEQTTLYQTDGTAAGTQPAPGVPVIQPLFQILTAEKESPLLLLANQGSSEVHVYHPNGTSLRIVPPGGMPATWVGKTTDMIFFKDAYGYLYWVWDNLTGGSTVADEYFRDTAIAVADLGEGAVAMRLDLGSGFEPIRIGPSSSEQLADIARDEQTSTNPEPFAVIDGFLAVTAPDLDRDAVGPATRLFKVDGAATQATLWSNLLFRPLQAAAGGLFLIEDDPTALLHFSDGQTPPAYAGAAFVTDQPGRSAATAERIYFTTILDGQDVWTSDGTSGGTRQIHDPHPDWVPDCVILCPPDAPQLPYRILADATQAFWDNEVELWRVDPAGAAPRLLEDGPNEVVQLAVWRGKLHYLRWRVEQGQIGVWQLWTSDGATASLVRELTAPARRASFKIAPLAAGFGDHVYFTLDGGDPQLWRTDGSQAGTVVFHDFGAGARIGELAAALAPAASRLYLTVATPGHGSELWTSDGESVTEIEIRAGSLGSHPAELRPLADGRVLFAADDGAHGHEPWISDGTGAGTRLLADVAPEASSPGQWAVQGNRVLFAAHSQLFGRELHTLELGVSLPPCPTDRLCLQDGRFEVEVEYAAPDGASGLGRSALTSASSGVFTFFSASNWELTVKVLDGCAINDRFWVFSAATTDVEFTLKVLDRATGETREYRNPAGALAAAITDTAAFASCAAAAPAPRYGPAAGFPALARKCPADGSAFCFGPEGRFKVQAAWQTADGAIGAATPVPVGSADSGLFTFFSPDNWELMVKVLDGCALNQHRWFFAAGTTNVGWTLTVDDLLDASPPKTYSNPIGTASPAIADTSAIACTP
jgi:ELWxxDGT repeat protein